MTAFTLVQLSDIHLSRSRPYFQFNYDIALEALAEIAPDAVVVTGDLALNGPDDSADVAFAAEQLGRIAVPCHVVPGNHDVGLVPFKGGLHQPINNDRLAIYRDIFGADRFAVEIGNWKLIGFNSQLLGSGLAEEEEQFAWLAAELGERTAPTALFLHYPLFIDTIDEDRSTHMNVVPAARRRVLDLVARAPGVKLIASGHLHEDRRLDLDGICYQWAPATAFMSSDGSLGGDAYNGFLVYRFDGDDFTVERVEPTFMINMDIRNWSHSEPHGYYEVVKRPFPSVG
ncbi:MAG: metallophosphoesterase [Hyphomicrobiaceae bacterium]|nr:metallophosphoesterase [Hyphomicrobiaceae bacterium]